MIITVYGFKKYVIKLSVKIVKYINLRNQVKYEIFTSNFLGLLLSSFLNILSKTFNEKLYVPYYILNWF